MSDVAQVAPGVYTVPHRVVAGKMGLIVGSRRSVAVDCGSDDAEGQALLDLARAGGRAPDWIVYTHGHSDHAGGGAPFRGAGVTAIAHVATPGVLRRLAEGRAARTGRRPEEVAAGLLWPEVLFAGELRLDLGGRTARLIPAPGHSPDSACLFLEPDGILFAGDTAVSAIPPAFGDGSGRALEATLRHLAGLGAAVLVPGHGAVLRGAPAVRAWLTWLADYLSALQEAAAGAVRAAGPGGGPAGTAEPGAPEGALLDETLRLAPAGALLGDRLPLDGAERDRRHRDNAARAVAEALAGSCASCTVPG
jgi:glyoxylase-like metal-dependent hydrolase (beta-lactamase superfamily II)